MGLAKKIKVPLDFMGENYKEAYLEFNEIPAIEFPELLAQINSLEEDDPSSLVKMVEILKQRFSSGKDDTGKQVEKEELDSLGLEAVNVCFSALTPHLSDEEGKPLDPKDETSTKELPKQSQTDNSTGK